MILTRHRDDYTADEIATHSQRWATKSTRMIGIGIKLSYVSTSFLSFRGKTMLTHLPNASNVVDKIDRLGVSFASGY